MCLNSCTYGQFSKNSNKGGEVALREPKDILVEMNNINKETNQILDEIKKLI